MNPAQDAQWQIALGEVEAEGQFGSVVIEAKSFGYCEIVLGLISAPNGIAEMAVYESDTPDDSTSWVVIEGTRVGEDKDSEGGLSEQPTETDSIYVWQIDLMRRKKYLALILDAALGTGEKTQAMGFARLSRGNKPIQHTTTMRV